MVLSIFKAVIYKYRMEINEEHCKYEFLTKMYLALIINDKLSISISYRLLIVL